MFLTIFMLADIKVHIRVLSELQLLTKKMHGHMLINILHLMIC